jgi:hypothetical protein
MIKDLPYSVRSAAYLPLSRVQIYSAEDDSLSLNLFVYGEEPKQLTEADVTTTGEDRSFHFSGHSLEGIVNKA